MKTISSPHFSVQPMKESDFVEANEMRMQSWLDTYPNVEHGISREWVESQHKRQLSADAQKDRIARFSRDVAKGVMAAWVARDESGKIIGSTTPYVDEDGIQHVGSLYVATNWHGTGVGNALAQKLIEWCDSTKPIELEVASYNKRARAFYRKWGFEELDGSERYHRDKIPVIKMIRKATQ